jgi:hypothetical protein
MKKNLFVERFLDVNINTFRFININHYKIIVWKLFKKKNKIKEKPSFFKLEVMKNVLPALETAGNLFEELRS